MPAIVLHTAGNLYSNLDLWLHGKAEWQAPSGSAASIGQRGFDQSFWFDVGAFVIVFAVTILAFVWLSRVTRRVQLAPPAAV